MSYVPHMGYARPPTHREFAGGERMRYTHGMGHAIHVLQLVSILLTLLLVVVLYRLVGNRRSVQGK